MRLRINLIQMTELSEKENYFREMTDAEKDTVMTNKDAQREANMLRANIGVDPETGMKGERKPTKEEYDQALLGIEELIEDAKTEPVTDKLSHKIGRLKEKLHHFIYTKVLSSDYDFEDNYWNAEHEVAISFLTDAAKKIKDMRDKAKDFEKASKD